MILAKNQWIIELRFQAKMIPAINGLGLPVVFFE